MGKSNNNAALEETKRANRQSQKNFELQMKMMAKQMSSAEAIEMPKPSPIPPGPTRSSTDVVAAGREARTSARRRYGFNQSVSQPQIALGSPTQL